jgi:hypothetical protein
LEQAQSIWSTLPKYPPNNMAFDEKSDGNDNNCTQQSGDNLFDVLSPKRPRSVTSVSELPEAISTLSKSTKTLSSVKKQRLAKNSIHTTKIGSIILPWPQYKITNTVYMNKNYTVTNTCSLDAALFVFYHSYKTSSSAFQALVQSDTTKYHSALKKLIDFVDNAGWDTARLYWLVSNKLLNKKNNAGEFDVKDTIYENVLQFIRPMQMYNIISECSCTVCPKRIRQRKCIDISLQ